MPQKISREVRDSVIRDWLSGKPRDTIAHDNMISTGAVTYIINEWRNDLNVYDADALRQLGIDFRKLETNLMSEGQYQNRTAILSRQNKRINLRLSLVVVVLYVLFSKISKSAFIKSGPVIFRL